MPELPEVETIKRELEKEVVGKTIGNVEIFYFKTINLPAKDFISRLKNSKIKSVKRRAKVLILRLDFPAMKTGRAPVMKTGRTGQALELSGNLFLVVHLKLTGQLIYRKKKTEEKYVSLIFYFNDGSILYFNDVRKFGYMKLFKKSDLDNFFKKMNLGPEPLKKDFTLAKFKKILQSKPRSKMKPLLMDQSFIAGIGNIYSQEACFYAGILPTRPVNALSDEEIKRLYQGLVKILKMAIDKKGSSVDDYIDLYGRQGDYVPLLKVYGRAGEKCFCCGEIIKKINLAGRGTCFCPRCQK